MNAFLRLLQLDNLTWSTISYQELPGRVMTVLFAYGIMSWNRFGLLTFSEPRAATRFVLIGVYSWLALAAVFWLIGRLTEATIISAKDAAIAGCIAHVPLVALGFFMAIVAGFARILGPGTYVAVVVVLAWMPAVIARALHELNRLPWSRAIPLAVIVQTAWLLSTGSYLHDQVGHLL